MTYCALLWNRVTRHTSSCSFSLESTLRITHRMAKGRLMHGRQVASMAPRGTYTLLGTRKRTRGQNHLHQHALHAKSHLLFVRLVERIRCSAAKITWSTWAPWQEPCKTRTSACKVGARRARGAQGECATEERSVPGLHSVPDHRMRERRRARRYLRRGACEVRLRCCCCCSDRWWLRRTSHCRDVAPLV